MGRWQAIEAIFFVVGPCGSKIGGLVGGHWMGIEVPITIGGARCRCTESIARDPARTQQGQRPRGARTAGITPSFGHLVILVVCALFQMAGASAVPEKGGAGGLRTRIEVPHQGALLFLHASWDPASGDFRTGKLAPLLFVVNQSESGRSAWIKYSLENVCSAERFEYAFTDNLSRFPRLQWTRYTRKPIAARSIDFAINPMEHPQLKVRDEDKVPLTYFRARGIGVDHLFVFLQSDSVERLMNAFTPIPGAVFDWEFGRSVVD